MATDRLPHPHDERASGLLGSVFGVAITAAMIGLAANVAIGLWTRSTVDSVAYDAAVRVATIEPSVRESVGSAGVEQRAIDDARSMLGEYGRKVDLRFIDAGDPELVALRVRAPGSSMLPRLFRNGPVVGGIDRVIVVRREQR